MTTRLAPWIGPLAYADTDASLSTTYPPSIGLEFTSTWEVVSGTIVDQAPNGRVRSRNFHAKPTYRFNVEHMYITEAQATELSNFYKNTKSLTIRLAWKDGVIYDCVWGARGMMIDKVKPTRWRASAELYGQAAT